MSKQIILCVDDEEIILNALQEQLTSTFGDEFEVETSDSGEDALEYIKELTSEGLSVPIVISDYIMPGMKGDELLKEVHRISPESLKILLTGQASIEGIANAINSAKLYRYIAKPWDKDDLVLTVKEALKAFLLELKIRKQNEELKELNASLEDKVVQRTKELQIANASKDKFFSIIAHDLKNPFNALLNLSEMMIDNWEMMDDNDKKDFLSEIHSSSKNTYNLLKNLLEWSRTQTGKITMEKVSFSPRDVLEQNIKVLTQHANNKNISITNQINEELKCLADLNMISTVFRNLLSNAIKFTNSDGKITISVSTANNTSTFCIADSGIGMTDEVRNNLFNITEKVQRTGTSNETGTGLGLLLCKEFVEKNQGEIFVESEQGKGSKFFFSLPNA